MNSAPLPLVSVVTPVYNNAEHLTECVESILAQTYANWDYTIVDNCSTDESLAIAKNYAARDKRIRVVSNDRFLRIVANHNHTVRHISPESKYCKFVFADDWLYPTCIEEMVRRAEQHPSVGLVGAFTTDGCAVLWHGPPYPSHRVPGREVCRSWLLGGEYVFAPMTSLLVRSDLVRKRVNFFNEHNLHADTESCFDVLQESDYSFIHQVLSFSRPRIDSTGSFAVDFNSIPLGAFVVFLKYGPIFLEETEYRQRLKKVRREYHHELACNVLRIRPKEFWKYHENTLAAFGARIDRRLLTVLVIAHLADCLSHPLDAVRKAWRWWSQALSTVSSGKRSVQTRRLP